MYQPARFEYRLTEKGRDLYGYALTLHQWSERWLMGEARSPFDLRHKTCGKVLRTEVTCSECHDVLRKPDEVTLEA